MKVCNKPLAHITRAAVDQNIKWLSHNLFAPVKLGIANLVKERRLFAQRK